MKSDFFSKLGSLLLFAVLTASVAQAQQYDDLYYDPSKDAGVRTKTTSNYDDEKTTRRNDHENSNVTRVADNYDDEYYDGDDYDYEYSTRIRRFHHNYRTYDYYDPTYVDLWFYDPYYLPGTTVYVVDYDDWGSYRRHCRHRYWNDWSFGYNPFGYNSWCGWNSYSYGGWGQPWYNPYVFNNYYYDPYWSYSGWNNYYCSPGYGYGYGGGWYNNNGYSNNGYGNHYPDKPKNTYTGPRRGGVVKTPPGLVSTTKQPGRVVTTDVDPASARQLPSTNGTRGENAGRQPEKSPARDPLRPSETKPSRENNDSPNEAPRPSRADRSAEMPSAEPSRRSDDNKINDEPRPTRRRDETRPDDSRPSRAETKSEEKPRRSTWGSDDSEPRRRSEPQTESRPQRETRSEPRYEQPQRSEPRSEPRAEPRRSEPAPSRSEPSRSSGGGGRRGGGRD